MRFGSLFSGIGGFDLGLERAGMRCAWQVEIDEFCQKVLAKHWPDVRRYRDIRECGKHNLAAVDLICGGFPCQPHSLAGKRKGAADDRDLWPEMRRVIDELRPTWVVAENVPGIRTTILDAALSDLEDIGYTVGTIVVPACAFDAPHRRMRLFIIAHTDRCEQGWREQSQREENQRDAESARDGAQGIAGAVAHTKGDGYSKGTECPGWTQPYREGRWPPEPDVGRVADGVPNRVDRLRSLGNAIVPQVAEWIGRRILLP